MTSIRRRLLWRLSLVALAFLLTGAAVLLSGVRGLLTDQFDLALRTKIATFATLLEQEGYAIELALAAQNMPEFSAEVEPEYVQIWVADGAPLYRCDSLGEADLPRLEGTLEAPFVRDIELPDGRSGRAIGAAFTVHDYEPGLADPGPARVLVVMARGRGPLDRAFLLLLLGTVGGIAALLVAWFALGRRLVARGLGPLDDLARYVSHIGEPAEAQAYAVEALPAELKPLVESHNLMLERIRAAFERERRTTANIAHELRAPVTELVILAEAAERFPADREENERRLRELREIGEQMSTLIATLLELTRIESGRAPLEIEAVDLVGMVQDCWAPMAAVASAKSQDLDFSPDARPLIRADRAALSILLANLLANAIEHAPAGEPIGCHVGNGNGRCRLVLSNAANGFRPEDVDKLTEPFWRANTSRTGRSHAGIGLALAKRLAELIDVELDFAVEAGEFRARLSFPAAAPGGADS